MLLHDTAPLNGVQGQTKDGNSQGDFLVARDGSRSHEAAGLALSVDDGASIALGADTDTAKGDQARSARLAAALKIHAANTSLSRSNAQIGDE